MNAQVVKEKTKNFSKFVSRHEIIFSVLTGVISGLINGLFGGGGGMLVVPMLTYFFKYSAKNAHATAILIILPLSIVSSIIYAVFGNINLSVLLPVGVGVSVGGIAGAFLLSKISSKWLTLIFSILMAVAGGKMLFF